MANYYVGLMSGTSLDAIDCVVVDFSNGAKLIAAESFPITSETRRRILELCQPSDNEIDKLGPLDRQLGIDFANAVTTTLSQHNIAHEDIVAIGSHGQTIRHRPNADLSTSFTLQIGDPNTIAHLTGIDTVADFRRKDIAAGGQGAPLVPAFHQAMFNQNRDCALLNIGGMANVSLLAEPLLGFDTGPGNVLIDQYCRDYFGADYDDEGHIAASGKIRPDLLGLLQRHPFFLLSTPKSCGRENFNKAWVEASLSTLDTPVSPKDLIATLTELTASSISQALHNSQRVISEIVVCGGGAFNRYLCDRIAALSGMNVTTSDTYGIAPQWMEAIAFAWFGMRTTKRLHSNCPSVTGASKEVVLGAIYCGN
jgi:anhydro-N-acetylmuramic acid kinase